MSKRKLDELEDLSFRFNRSGDRRPPQQKAGDLADPCGFEETSKASYELGTAAYRMREHQVAINVTSLGLGTIIEKQVALLDVRAAAYGLAGQFEHGIRDAEEMIRLVPHATVGYRRAGELLCMQGYAHRAIKLYRQGLEKVNDEHRWILLDGCNAAEGQADKRIDVIANAPYDILTNIMQYLTTDKCISLLNVSKSWRMRISECPAVWSRIDIIEGDPLGTTNMSFFAHVSSHVTSINLDHLDGRVCEVIFSHIATGNFEKLEKIWMNACRFQSVAGFFSAMTGISRTLKELTIEVGYGNGAHPDIPFNKVLATCRNLQSFKYYNQYCKNGSPHGYIGSIQTSTVTSLSIAINNTGILDLEDTLRFCPDIRHLELLHFSTSANMDIIRRYCKNLISFSFNMPHHNEITACIKSSQENKETGIRHLALRIEEPRNFRPLFTEHCTTIESLNLFINPDSNDLISLLTGVDEFSSLERLAFSFGGRQIGDFAATILSKTPRLRRLSFKHCTITESRVAMQIARLRHLEKLMFFHCKVDGAEDTAAIFDGIAARGGAAALREVLLLSVNIDLEDIMEPMTSISTLRRIDLAHFSPPTQVINQFCAKLRLHPRIEDVRFNDVKRLKNDALGYLSDITTLRRLELRDLRNITKDCLSSFDETVTMVISGCKYLDDT